MFSKLNSKRIPSEVWFYWKVYFCVVYVFWYAFG